MAKVFEFNGEEYLATDTMERFGESKPNLGGDTTTWGYRWTNRKTSETGFISPKRLKKYMENTSLNYNFVDLQKQIDELKAENLKLQSAGVKTLRAPYINKEGTVVVPSKNRRLPIMFKPEVFKELFERQEEIKRLF